MTLSSATSPLTDCVAWMWDTRNSSGPLLRLFIPTTKTGRPPVRNSRAAGLIRTIEFLRRETNALCPSRGFCTPGMLLAAQELLVRGGVSSREEIRAHLSGNYCRCTGYQAIVDAVEAVARMRLGQRASRPLPEEEPVGPRPVEEQRAGRPPAHGDPCK